MPRKPPIIFPQEQRLLSEFAERLKLARKRRKLSSVVVAQRAGISRTSLYKVETGDPGATLGTYLRVLAVLGLEGDINALAADDKVPDGHPNSPTCGHLKFPHPERGEMTG
jgi:transcriptional regulator with XRE-family HTH domain